MEELYATIAESYNEGAGLGALAEDCDELVSQMVAIDGKSFDVIGIGLVTSIMKALRNRGRLASTQLTMALTNNDEAAEREVFRDLAVAIQERGACLNTLLKWESE